MRRTKAGTGLRIGLFLGVLLAFLGARAAGLGDNVDPQALQAWLVESGPWGPVAYCLAFPLWTLLGLPNALLVLAAGLTWTPVMAILVAWSGCMFSAIVVFELSRHLGREWTRRHFATRLDSFDAQLASRPVTAIAGARLAFFLAIWVSAALALSRVSTRDYLIGTSLGVTPWIVVLIAFGEGVVVSLRSGSFWLAPVLLIVLILPVFLHRRWTRRVAARAPLEEVKAGPDNS